MSATAFIAFFRLTSLFHFVVLRQDIFCLGLRRTVISNH